MNNYTIQLENNWKITNYEDLKLEIGIDEYWDSEFYEDEYIKINIFDFHRNYNFQRDLDANFMYIFDDFSNYTKADKENSSDWYYYQQEKKQLAEIRKKYHVFWLEFYEHSAIRFDIIDSPRKCICQYRSRDGSSKVGFIAVSKELAKTRGKAMKIAETQLEDYNNYINWRVYEYRLLEKEDFFSKDLKRKIENFEYYDGCTWFYQEETCEDDAISSIKNYLNSKGIEYDRIELVEN